MSKRGYLGKEVKVKDICTDVLNQQFDDVIHVLVSDLQNSWLRGHVTLILGNQACDVACITGLKFP